MRKLVIVGLAASAMVLSVVTPGAALPPVGFSTPPQEDAKSSLDEARVFCYNRYTGRFKHWGYCNYRPAAYNVPRVYCRNRWTGQFLHWGSCWR